MNMKDKTQLLDAILVNQINAELKEKGLLWSDSDMFIYCEWYTGSFWLNQLQDKQKVA